MDARVRRALEVVGLKYEEFAERSPFELSGGEKRRVAIAGVIAMQPKVLVLDEPVAGLDPVGRAEILALIKQLQQDVSPTIIMVSHNMDDIAVLADRIIAMHNGRIELDGTPEEVFCNREKIKEIGLDLPLATRLRDKLVESGVSLPDGIVTPKQLEKALSDLKQGGKATEDADKGVQDV